MVFRMSLLGMDLEADCLDDTVDSDLRAALSLAAADRRETLIESGLRRRMSLADYSEVARLFDADQAAQAFQLIEAHLDYHAVREAANRQVESEFPELARRMAGKLTAGSLSTADVL